MPFLIENLEGALPGSHVVSGDGHVVAVVLGVDAN